MPSTRTRHQTTMVCNLRKVDLKHLPSFSLTLMDVRRRKDQIYSHIQEMAPGSGCLQTKGPSRYEGRGGALKGTGASHSSRGEIHIWSGRLFAPCMKVGICNSDIRISNHRSIQIRASEYQITDQTKFERRYVVYGHRLHWTRMHLSGARERTITICGSVARRPAPRYA